MRDVSGTDMLGVARLRLMDDRPYFSAVIWALQPVPVKDFAKQAPGPIGVDAHLRLYYDPEALAKYSKEELSAILCHEVGHVIRAHSHRVGDRKEILVTDTGMTVSAWNIAGDMEINDDLQDEGLTFDDAWVLPDKPPFKLPRGLMAEEYYELILQNAQKMPVGGAGHGDCGSVADNIGRSHEQDGGGTGNVPPGISATEQELIRRKVAEDVLQHQKTRGNVPNGLVRWAQTLLKPKVNWRQMLRAFIRRAVGAVKGAVDYSYTKPGRRSGALRDFVWPSLRQPVPQVAIVVDTSGSMSEKELMQALAEIEGVLSSSGTRTGVTVLSVDAAVHTTQKVFKARDVKLVGGGGTDMTRGIEAAEALRPRPHVLIVVTDCETPWPLVAPRVPVIVVKTQRGKQAVPSWATVVDAVPE